MNVTFIVQFQETASVETVSNVIPSVVNNETECPETRGCDNGNIGDGKMIQFRETASAETMSDVSLRVECVNNNATERSDIRKSGNCFNGAADQRSQTVYLHVSYTVYDKYKSIVIVDGDLSKRN